jgi:hypothetical protein
MQVLINNLEYLLFKAIDSKKTNIVGFPNLIKFYIYLLK